MTMKSKLLAMASMYAGILGGFDNSAAVKETTTRATPKQILPKKEWKRRKAKLRMQKHSRAKNRL